MGMLCSTQHTTKTVLFAEASPEREEDEDDVAGVLAKDSPHRHTGEEYRVNKFKNALAALVSGHRSQFLNTDLYQIDLGTY